MQTRLIVDPISTCNSPEPNMNASGTTTCRFTKCDIIPVDVETCLRNEKNDMVNYISGFDYMPNVCISYYYFYFVGIIITYRI